MPIDAATRLTDFCRRNAVLVAVAALVGTVLLAVYAARHLGMNTNEESLLAAELPFKQREAELDRAFPQRVGRLVAVVDGLTPGRADDAAHALAVRLAERPDLFKTVREPGGEMFFRRNGVLLLPVDEIQAMADHLIEAQPMIGRMAADPSLRGVFGAIDLALEGVARGEAGLGDLDRPLAALGDMAANLLAGRYRPLAWQSLMTGREPGAEEFRRFVVTQPILDYTDMAPGRCASQAIREAAEELGLTIDRGVSVRLTGPVALTDEEFSSVAEGAGVSLAVSFALVCLWLFLALRSARLIVAILGTLVAGLVATAAFAAATVRDLNPISVAFAVLFVGIAVDFSIQFSVRYRHERHLADSAKAALRNTTLAISGPLLLAAAATAIGFLSFLPTAYVGVSQLGLIAGTGMLIAVGLNLSLLPALLTLVHPPAEPAPVGFARAGPVDRFLGERWRGVLAAALVLCIAAAAVMPRLHFDYDPMNLKDPKTESVATALDLMSDPMTTPYTLNVLEPSVAAAVATAARLDALPEVDHTLGIDSFVPDRQPEKVAIIEDLREFIVPTLNPARTAPPPSPDQVRAAIVSTVGKLRAVANEPGGAARRLADLLDAVLHHGLPMQMRLHDAVSTELPKLLQSLRLMLDAGPVTLADIPPEISADWISRDGRALIEVYPSGDVRDPDRLDRFVAAVRSVAPDATGAPVSIRESGRVIVEAFTTAGAMSIGAITLLLAVVLRNMTSVLLVVVPLLVAGLLTLATCVAVGIPINFANIIAFPLLLGIGVSFNIYFVMNWRAGLTGHLQSSTARAIVFSAFTTTSAFGSLALSPHRGTASMGVLLALALAYTLVTTLLLLPALFKVAPRPPQLGAVQANRSIEGST